MKFIYSYTNCSEKKYRQLFGDSEKFVLRADQKYHSLLIKGFAESNVNVCCLSGLPISRQVKKQLFVNEPDEFEGSISYHYYKSLNIPILRQIMVFFGGFLNVLFSGKENSYLICDFQNLANAYGTLLAAKLRRIPTIVIVMDLPDFLSGKKIVQKMYEGTFKLADSFIFLTEQMNDVVNKKNKPYIVIEGIADSSATLSDKADLLKSKTGKDIVVYAGSLAKIYGIENLVDGFLNANLLEAQLWIYGDGDYLKELEKICQNHDNIIYKGVHPNEEVFEVEKKASLLVNPRPTSPKYTRYSFPSKTIEYMASGTPLLTTRLPGIPEEYYEFFYTIDGDTAEDVSKALKKVFSYSAQDRTNKGLSARDFVLSQKSNLVQSKKIIGFIEKRV